jgi:hypothetical protein
VGAACPGTASTPRLDRCDNSDQRDSDDSTDPADSQEPIEQIDSAEPTLPIEANEPTLPIDSIDPLEQIDSMLSCDHNDQREPDPFLARRFVFIAPAVVFIAPALVFIAPAVVFIAPAVVFIAPAFQPVRRGVEPQPCPAASPGRRNGPVAEGQLAIAGPPRGVSAAWKLRRQPVSHYRT